MYKLSFWFIILIGSPYCQGIPNDDDGKVTLKDIKFGDDGQDVLDVVVSIPGAHWCAVGELPKDDSLGYMEQLDTCCRDHAKCPDSIDAGESKHGLTNSGMYKRYTCDCDDKFRKCLHAVTGLSAAIAFTVGKAYFNEAGRECFREDFPVIGCEGSSGLISKCTNYKYDKKGKKRFQFFYVDDY